MNKKNELTSFNGIDTHTAGLLADQGIDSVDKLAVARAQDLAGIEGLQPDQITAIIEEAKQLTEDSLSELVEDAARLKAAVEKLVLHIRDRINSSDTSDKKKKALRKEISLTLGSLEKVEAALSEQLLHLSRSLAKADARISRVADSNVEEIMDGLKKARKKIDKAME